MPLHDEDWDEFDERVRESLDRLGRLGSEREVRFETTRAPVEYVPVFCRACGGRMEQWDSGHLNCELCRDHESPQVYKLQRLQHRCVRLDAAVDSLASTIEAIRNEMRARAKLQKYINWLFWLFVSVCFALFAAT